MPHLIKKETATEKLNRLIALNPDYPKVVYTCTGYEHWFVWNAKMGEVEAYSCTDDKEWGKELATRDLVDKIYEGISQTDPPNLFEHYYDFYATEGATINFRNYCPGGHPLMTQQQIQNIMSRRNRGG